MFGPFMNVFFVPLLKVDYVVIADLLDERVLVEICLFPETLSPFQEWLSSVQLIMPH
jgi:hypothetical protein